MIGDTWSPIAAMRDLNYFLAAYSKHKEILHQLDFIGLFLQANVKHILYVQVDRRFVHGRVGVGGGGGERYL